MPANPEFIKILNKLEDEITNVKTEIESRKLQLRIAEDRLAANELAFEKLNRI